MKLLFLLFKALKAGKWLTTGGTMLLSVVVYGIAFGWMYAVGFVLLLLAHEMGHFLAARQRGLAVGMPTFIPFVGAWIEMKDLPHDVETEAYVGIAGPFVGTLAAFGCYYLSDVLDSSLLLAISYAGFFLNLFNMIPVSPLDGGRITAVLSPRIWLLGVPILVGAFLLHPSPMFLLIGILAFPQLAKAWRYDPAAPENAVYYRISAEQRTTYASWYLILVVVLAAMSYSVHEKLGAAGFGAG